MQPIRKRGQRGQDKAPRKPGGGRKAIDHTQKVKSYSVQLTPAQNDEIIKIWGSRTKAIISLINKKSKIMYRLTATAPTVYQLNSVRAFGSPIIQNPDGSHTFSAEFDTVQEGKAYLIERAERYFEDAEESEKAIADIKKYGSLRIDAVTGSIEKVIE